MDKELMDELIDAIQQNTMKIESLINSLDTIGDALNGVRLNDKFKDKLISKIDEVINGLYQ